MPDAGSAVAMPEAAAPLELWAGAECSVVRVGNRYIDQLALTGTADRPDDVDRLARLGVRALRVPVLWERTWPNFDSAPDWTYADHSLKRLRALGIRPIVGLVHHGSGPAHTSLLERSFITGLARFASAVARRYPWVEDYAPVDEPVASARFSTLYGRWYPHARDEASFVRALAVQCRATREAMRAIREVTAHARLVQTEDFGTTCSTPRLSYQARLDNLRRYASLDLLSGRVGPGHALHDYLVEHGLFDVALRSFADQPCPPDLIGVSHRIGSDRFLDEDVDSYAASARVGNAFERYADVDAVRVQGTCVPSCASLLEALWARYRTPLAITASHIRCRPEAQVHWLVEAWEGAQAARRKGVDVRAVTAWSAFGSYDWDSLLTEPRGHYQPGLFDLRGGFVRATASAGVARELALGGRCEHPLARDPPWWRRGVRRQHPAHGHRVAMQPAQGRPVRAQPGQRHGVQGWHGEGRPAHAPLPHGLRAISRRPVLVTGASGTLGRAIAEVCQARGMRTVLLGRPDLDVTDRLAVANALDAHRPWAVVNAAGYVRVDDAERERHACFSANAEGAMVLARACAARRIRLATFSSALVFDGRLRRAYVEGDRAAPLGVYGTCKALAEEAVLASFPEALVVRSSAFFAPCGGVDFLSAALHALGRDQPFPAATDRVVSPTYVPDLADAVVTLLVDHGAGIWHLANTGAVSWHDFARAAATRAGLDTALLVPCSTGDLGLQAPRPAYSALASVRGGLMPPLEHALERFVDAWRQASVVGRLSHAGVHP